MPERSLVVGMGRSGRAVARLLRSHGAEVVWTDASTSRVDVPADLADLEWAGREPTDALIDTLTSVVLSPGVDPKLPFVERARSRGVRISGEVEEAWRCSHVPVIAITGTNGKSTTTTLISWLLERGGVKAPAGGNLGTPYAELVALAPRADYHVVEVSSFQGETLETFRPKVGVFLNLTPDHLDRHGDLASYGLAKRRVFEAQTSRDWLCHGVHPSVTDLVQGLASRPIVIGVESTVGAWLEGENIVAADVHGVRWDLGTIGDLTLVGAHQIENVLASLSAVAALGRLSAETAPALRAFRGMSHRMEFVGTLAGLHCYDDSKATNVEAALAGVGGLDAPILLICGGQDDGQDYDGLAALPGVKAAFGIGDASARVARAFGDRGHDAGSMRAAITSAMEHGVEGDAIVMSPAGKSFDRYRDFAERGRHFKRIVAELESARRAGPRREFVHFIGVGGAGMSALAEVALRRGAFVTGSDREDGPALRRLRRLGALVRVGHDPETGADARKVIVSSAIRDDNPEVIAARERGVPVVHRGDALAELLEGRRGVAVTGSHGKTTTSAMIASALKASGRDPLALVGGDLLGENTNVLFGSGEFVVCEADESDGSFAVLRPRIAVITNLDRDHLDHYGSMDGLIDAFRRWIAELDDDVVICIGDGDEVLAGLVNGRRALVCGTSASADVRVTEVLVHTRGTRFRVTVGAESAICALPILGRHNVANAAVAVGALHACGLPVVDAARALSKFGGVARRVETKGEVRGVRVIDDYAHHPAEVAAVLDAVREHGARRVRVVFQPHRYSRTRTLEGEFAAALSAADDVIVSGIYGADESDPGDRWDHRIAELIDRRAGVKGRRIDDFEEIARVVAEESRRGDVVLLLSAGDLSPKVAPLLLAALDDSLPGASQA